MTDEQAVIFDIDNTLIDDDFAVKSACKTIYQIHSNSFDKNFDSFLNSWFAALHKYFPRYLNGSISFTEQRVKRISEVFKDSTSQLTGATANAIFEDYLKSYENNWKLYDESRQGLDRLQRKYKLGIISNGQKEQQIQKLETTHLKAYFSEIVISSDVGCRKPDPKIFICASTRLGIPSKNCFYIGDNIAVDIQGANSAGMTGIWLNRKGKSTTLNIEEIKCLTEVEYVIKKENLRTHL